jgi:glycosyltransferase involved in cell wall biosynthesis
VARERGAAHGCVPGDARAAAREPGGGGGVLRIGVDAREILGDATGVGRYLAELLRRWTARADACRRQFVLFAPETIPMPFPEGTVAPRIISGGRGTWWEQTALRRAVQREALDVFFAPAYTAPLGVRLPLAVTIHDVSFLAHPEWFRPREGLRRRWLTGRAAASAAVVFTDSEFSRSEIERHLRVKPGSIRVIPPGVLPRHESAPPEPRERLVLYAGSIFNRRRLPDLIQAFSRATADLPDARLVIVGDDRTWPPQDLQAVAAEHRAGGRVELLDYVDDAQLASLYRRASVFAFLSEYEGFGLTPLEALAAGVPPVVLDTPVAREVYGPAALYVQRGDVEGTARTLRRLLIDVEAGAGVLARAQEVLGRYSWEAAADQTLSAIERAARPA